MANGGREYVVNEARLGGLRGLGPNVVVLPWGALEAHGYHLPHGTDVIEATAIAEAAVGKANEMGGKCVVLPCVPFGIDHTQVGNQVATITLRGKTQQAILYDVAASLLEQGIERLVVMNFHGGNDFKTMIRDVMYELPIFIVEIFAARVAPGVNELLEHGGFHANEFETSLMLHLRPDLVVMDEAGDGKVVEGNMPRLEETVGVFYVRNWPALTADTGVGDPRKGTAEKGEKIFEMLVGPVAEVLAEFSKAKEGEYPLVIQRKRGNGGSGNV